MIYDNGIYRELTQEEITQMQLECEQAETLYWKNISYEEAVDMKIREKYSLSQELAILRQRDEKPEEYAAYFTYCEDCKAFVKTKKGIQ